MSQAACGPPGKTCRRAVAVDTRVIKPFIKWVGGKRQLLPELQKRLPERIVDYYEPFIGGGALMWTLNRQAVRSISINDHNAELINLYQVVRDRPHELVQDLSRHENTAEYYYAVRAMDREPGYQQLSPVVRASRFIFLNKTGYNGLYRVNAKGHNNVPFGRYRNPAIRDEQTLLACSEFLQDVRLLNGDFSLIQPMLDADAFVYLDPPYVPLSGSSSFTGYTQQGFDLAMQQRLRDFCNCIDAAGGKFLLSNSDTPLVRELYADYLVEQVQAARAVNSKAGGRGKISELLVRNYS